MSPGIWHHACCCANAPVWLAISMCDHVDRQPVICFLRSNSQWEYAKFTTKGAANNAAILSWSYNPGAFPGCWAVYTKYSDGHLVLIYLNSYDPSGWDYWEESGAFYLSDYAIGSDDTGHLIFRVDGSDRDYITHDPDGVFSSGEHITSVPTGGTMALNSNGDVQSAYSASGNAYHRSRVGGVWQSATLLKSGYLLSIPAVAIAPDGTVYVAYADGGGYGAETQQIVIHKYSSGSWSSKTLFLDIHSVPSYARTEAVDLCCDQNSALHITCHRYWYDGTVHHSGLHFHQGSPGDLESFLQAEVFVSSNDLPGSPRMPLVTDVFGTIVTARLTADYQVQLYCFNGSTWREGPLTDYENGLDSNVSVAAEGGRCRDQDAHA